MNQEKRKKVEVIVAATRSEVWNVVRRRGVATQEEIAPDAEYIAFFQVGRKNEPSAITHIAKVRGINHRALTSEYLEKNPKLLVLSEKENKGWENSKYYTEYRLEEIKELSEPIIEKKRVGTRCQVRLYTTLEQIKKAKYLSDIKTLNQSRGDERKIKRCAGKNP